MRDLTAADVAFLLCGTKLGSFSLILATDFGLFLDISSDGTITASLERPSTSSGRRRSIGPITPVSPIRSSIDTVLFTPTSTISPSFPTSFPSSSLSLGYSTPTSPQFPRELSTPSSSPNGKKPLSIMTIHPPSIPTPESTPPAGMSHPGYKYVITSAFGSSSGPRKQSLLSSSTSNYIFYSPSWPHNPRSSTLSSLQVATPRSPNSPASDSREAPPPEILVGEEDLEARYSAPSGPRSGNWLDSYLDWVSRSQKAFARQRRRAERRARENRMTGHSRSNSSSSSSSSGSNSEEPEGTRKGARGAKKTEGRGPFRDDGESTLWMVEGLLLAAWLCLQADCAGVEYAPWGYTGIHPLGGERGNGVEDEVYVLEKNNVGKVIENVLVNLNRP